MTTNRQVRQAICDALEDIGGLNTYLYPEDAIVVPAAIVAGFEMTEVALGGGADITAKVLVAVSRSHTQQLERLDELLDLDGAGSVIAAINDRIDADDISLAVLSVGDYGTIEWGETAYYGAVANVRVLT